MFSGENRQQILLVSERQWIPHYRRVASLPVTCLPDSEHEETCPVKMLSADQNSISLTIQRPSKKQEAETHDDMSTLVTENTAWT